MNDLFFEKHSVVFIFQISYVVRIGLQNLIKNFSTLEWKRFFQISVRTCKKTEIKYIFTLKKIGTIVILYKKHKNLNFRIFLCQFKKAESNKICMKSVWVSLVLSYKDKLIWEF